MEPKRIKCRDIHSLPTHKVLREHLDRMSHVVLEFENKRWWQVREETDIESAISILREHFSNCSVFHSGGDKKSEWVTIYPVVSSENIHIHKKQIIEAVDSYIARCIHLEEQRLQEKLSDEWETFVHGGHCRYENFDTGETVEAPLEITEKPENVDPYFFAKYVKSINLFPEVASLITDDFHDTARILDVIYGGNQNYP